ncbi:MAG: helix-turn-helix domain-containing protein [Candidatus Eremiobacteraeota bacterium]|nr:helix-turn-helix domain-containing protein [Candidatus Eremiobacteraeota bacterium]
MNCKGPEGFGAVLKRLRKAAGLSQEGLAERAGVSVAAIGALESGLRNAPYRRTVSLLANALQLPPSKRNELEEAAAQAKGVIAVRRRSHRTPSPFGTQIPRSLRHLVGREREIAQIVTILPESRMVTLVGPGGIGKTSVALETAHRLHEAKTFEAAVLCDLSVLTDGGAVASAIAASLDLDPENGWCAAPSVHDEKRTLIVVDNCEHVIDAAAQAVAMLLRKTTHVAVLATSRERLGISGERTVTVPSLALPARLRTGALTARDAASYAAVALFVECAAAHNAARVLSDESSEAVAELCRQLDGIPLAIELAAAQLRVLSLSELAARLHERLRLLDSGARDAPSRHRTLRATFDWSYELLDVPLQRFFRRLGVFVGGFTLEGALAVCCDHGEDELSALGKLAVLADKSLLVAEPADPTRYHLLETTRSYALDRLVAAREYETIMARHLAAMRVLAEQTESPTDDPQHTQRLTDAIAAELDNVRAALGWSLDKGDIVAGAALAAAIGIRWEKLRLTNEGIARLQAFTECLPDDEVLVCARVWTALAFLLGNALRVSDALGAAQQAVVYGRKSGDPTVLFNALRADAVFAAWQEHFDEAVVALREAQAIAVSSQSPRMALLAQFASSHVARARGDLAEASEALRHTAAIARDLGDAYREFNAMLHLAEVAHERGSTREAIDIVRRFRAGHTLEPEDDEAMLANLSGYLVSVGDTSGTYDAARNVIALNEDAKRPSPFATTALEHVALARALEDDLPSAARLLGYCSTGYAELGFKRQSGERRTNERLLALLRDRLAADTLATLLQEGARLQYLDAQRIALRRGMPAPHL